MPKNHNRTVPSAMYIYPIEFYVILEKGIFKYDHILIPIVEGNFSEKLGGQDFVKNASMNLIMLK